MKDFLGNELQPGDTIVINKNTQTGSSTSRKVLYKTKVERLTKLQVVTENHGYIYPDNVIKIPANKEIDPSYLKRLKEMEGSIRSGFPEVVHPEADDILCNILKDLGFEEIVEAYDKVPKWYS